MEARENAVALETQAQIKNLNGWLNVSKAEKGLADVLFCPKDLRSGDIADYIEEAQNMLVDYQRGNFKDITDKIL